jgi:hypothetical protein
MINHALHRRHLHKPKIRIIIIRRQINPRPTPKHGQRPFPIPITRQIIPLRFGLFIRRGCDDVDRSDELDTLGISLVLLFRNRVNKIARRSHFLRFLPFNKNGLCMLRPKLPSRVRGAYLEQKWCALLRWLTVVDSRDIGIVPLVVDRSELFWVGIDAFLPVFNNCVIFLGTFLEFIQHVYILVRYCVSFIMLHLDRNQHQHSIPQTNSLTRWICLPAQPAHNSSPYSPNSSSQYSTKSATHSNDPPY